MNTSEQFRVLRDWIVKQGIATPTAIMRLAGDGSTRTFYRVSLPSASYVLLSDPEWILSRDYAPHQEYLQAQGLPVPRFYQRDPGQGLMLMEDLGDELLQSRLLAQPDTKMAWLRTAATLLAELHGKTYPVPAELPVSQRRFDATKYLEELQFTFEHLAGRYLDLTLTRVTPEALRQFATQIAAIGPDVFAHRDYHCRNILLHREKPYLIDFQDARLGSPHYDLCSLVYDAYVPISEAERSELVSCYRDGLARYAVSKQIDWENFPLDLQAVALQRTVKAAGSFASFYTRFGKSTHLEYLLPALRSAQQILETHPKLPTALKKALPLTTWITKIENSKVK